MDIYKVSSPRFIAATIALVPVLSIKVSVPILQTNMYRHYEVLKQHFADLTSDFKDM